MDGSLPGVNKQTKDAVVVDFTVWVLERLWGATIHSGEQRGHAGQLVSTDPRHLLSCDLEAISCI